MAHRLWHICTSLWWMPHSCPRSSKDFGATLRWLASRLSFPATGPPDPGRVSEGFLQGSLKGFLKGFRRGQPRTPSKILQKPFKTPFRDPFRDPFRNPSETLPGSGGPVAGNESLEASIANQSAWKKGSKVGNSRKWSGKGAKGLLDPRSEKRLALIQDGVAPVQKLPGSKRNFAPPHNHFREFSVGNGRNTVPRALFRRREPYSLKPYSARVRFYFRPPLWAAWFARLAQKPGNNALRVKRPFSEQLSECRGILGATLRIALTT